MPVTGHGRVFIAVFVRIVPNTDSAAPLVRTCYELPCTPERSAPPLCKVGTCTANTNMTDLLHNVVVSAGEALHSAPAVGDVVSLS